jgi:parvulin-like peptidyl-prolyl isomerase
MMEGATFDSVSRDFGNDFAKRILILPKGHWIGPIGSSYGSHLVFVDQRQPAVVPRLRDIQNDVLREWENDRQITERENRYRALRRSYNVTIDAGRSS